MTQEERIQDLESSLNEALFKNAELESDNERLREDVAELRWEISYLRENQRDNFETW